LLVLALIQLPATDPITDHLKENDNKIHEKRVINEKESEITEENELENEKECEEENEKVNKRLFGLQL
jgi:hypothetical protein